MQYINLILPNADTNNLENLCESLFTASGLLNESADSLEYYHQDNHTVIEVPVLENLDPDTVANQIANLVFETNFKEFDIEIPVDYNSIDEVTIEDDQDFNEEFGILGFVEGDPMWEAEYQGRKVKLNKPVRSSDGPKKFHVYVKNPKGNVVKVNFGDPDMEIKADNPERKKSFRARHNCDNPGPKTKARYWSCRAW